MPKTWKINMNKFSGDNSEEDPPVPIPNTEVKLLSAWSTWETWEIRTSPDFFMWNYLEMDNLLMWLILLLCCYTIEIQRQDFFVVVLCVGACWDMYWLWTMILYIWLRFRCIDGWFVMLYRVRKCVYMFYRQIFLQ